MRFLAKTSLTVLLLACAILPGSRAEEKTMLNSSAYILNHPNLSRKVSLALNDTNIVDALVYLSEKADINVAVSKTVEGRATLSLNNVSIRDALDIILLSNELAMEKRGEIFYVMPAADYETMHGEKWSEARQVKMFKLQHARPADVANVLTSLKSRVGSIVIDNESSTLVAMDTPEKIEQMSQAIESLDHETVSKVFNLQYVNAKDAEAALATRLNDQGMGTVKSDEKYNRLIITAPPGRMAEAENLVKQLDARLKQVLIEAKIVSVKLEPGFEYGIDWQRMMTHSFRDKYRVMTLESSFPFDETLTNFGKIMIGKVGASDVDLTIQALKEIGETKLLSSPRISALNNEEAKIFVGTKEVYTTSTTTLSSNQSSTAVQVNFVDVGVNFKVTPIINDNSEIIMKIRPEISRIDHNFTDADGNKIPVVDTTNAETRVMVKDGSTIIIGGLIKNELRRDSQQLPLLGDIPLVGALFKHVREDKNKTEMVVFLTPHIIDGIKDMSQFDKKQTKPLKGYDDNA